jgi:hypothetical protein
MRSLSLILNSVLHSKIDMKNIVIYPIGCILFLFCWSPLRAQKDTFFIKNFEETGVLEKQRFIDRYDFLFRTQQPTKWLFKAIAPEGSYHAALLNLAIERKITPGFSLQAGYGLGVFTAFSNSDSTIGGGPSRAVQRARLEGRWYYDMPRRIRQGLCANNMSGNYIGFEANLSNAYYPLSDADGYRYNLKAEGLLRYGIQRRFFRYAFFDISYGIGAYKRWTKTSSSKGETAVWGLAGNTRLAFGLSIASPNKKAVRSDYCSVWRCHVDQYKMFKISLNDAFVMQDFDNFKMNFNPAFEKKIGESAFSVQLEGKIGLERYLGSFAGTSYENREFSTWAEIQGRYYFTLKNRMARGETGNNLAGLYVAAAFNVGYEDQYSSSGNITGQDVRRFGLGPMGRLGFQQNVFKRGFVDLFMFYDLKFLTIEGIDEDVPLTGNATNFGLSMNLRAGLAF